MKYVVLALSLLLLCQGFFSAWTDLGLYNELGRRDAQTGALYARTDSLEAYVADLWVRVDRLEVLEGL